MRHIGGAHQGARRHIIDCRDRSRPETQIPDCGAPCILERAEATQRRVQREVQGAQAVAQDENLKLHFGFSQTDGTNVTDVVGGVTAKLMGAAKVEQVGKYGVLNLGNATGYLNMTSAAGAVVKSLYDFTVSACYCVDSKASLSGNGYFLWVFSTLTSWRPAVDKEQAQRRSRATSSTRAKC